MQSVGGGDSCLSCFHFSINAETVEAGDTAYGPKRFLPPPPYPHHPLPLPLTVKRKEAPYPFGECLQSDMPRSSTQRSVFFAPGRFEGKRKEWWGSGGGEKTLGAVWVVSPPPVCVSKKPNSSQGKPSLHTPDVCAGSRRPALEIEHYQPRARAA